jgi:hypothetical protein
MTIRIGREARLEGLFAPAMVSRPPANVLCRTVLPLSRDLASPSFSRRQGVSRTIGARRSFDQASAISSVGCRTRIGEGSWSM